MSWIDQCGLAFKVRADSILWRGQLGQWEILTRLAKESGIPIKVLRNWWGKNGNKKSFTSSSRCIKCRKHPVFLSRGKPLGPESKAYGLCGTCRNQQ